MTFHVHYYLTIHSFIYLRIVRFLDDRRLYWQTVCIDINVDFYQQYKVLFADHAPYLNTLVSCSVAIVTGSDSAHRLFRSLIAWSSVASRCCLILLTLRESDFELVCDRGVCVVLIS